MNVLELLNATKVFGGGLFKRNTTVAVDNVSLGISGDDPKITCIAGESGSGKTTLARMLLGVIAPNKGVMLFDGKDVSSINSSEKRRFRREVQPIFQDPFGVYNPFYKVNHVLRMPIEQFSVTDTEQEARKLIHDALEMVGLLPEETLDRYPHQLSGGQRQRVMVARALLLKPKVILADEPVSMVDASLRATILNSILKLNRELGISVVYITHDLTTAYQMADDLLIMYQGSIVESGKTEKLIKDPKHPYTQLLVESIPSINPDTEWYSGRFIEMTPHNSDSSSGCKFTSRCPSAMEICRNKVPELYDLDRKCACFLYKDGATFASSQAEVLERPSNEKTRNK